MSEIAEILTDLGYKLTPDNSGWRARPIYRESDNNTSLKVFKDTGSFVDFSAGISGSLEQLVKMTLNLQDIGSAKQWLKTKEFHIQKVDKKPTIKSTKVFSNDVLNSLVQDDSYWIGRGISKETTRQFRGGIVTEGRMKWRYVFPIFNSSGNVVGLAGRCLFKTQDPSRPKYKIIGERKNFVWPAFLNHEIIKQKKEVILIESPACALALFNNNIKHCLCLFGTDIGVGLLNYLLRMSLDRIIIATNNEPDNHNIGNLAAEKLQKKLLKYFDKERVYVALPWKKDFAEQTATETIQWYDGFLSYLSQTGKI